MEKKAGGISKGHKITETTEKRNFHLHRQMEIIFALSGNLKCKFETGEIDILRNGLILFNQMDLHYIYPEDGSGICDRYVLYFSSNYISRFSTPEVNLLECFLFRPGNQPVVLTVPDRQLTSFSSVSGWRITTGRKAAALLHLFTEEICTLNFCWANFFC